MSSVRSGIQDCPECGFPFKHAHSLEQHIRNMHRGEKPYACAVCRRRFAIGAHLVLHTRTHTGEKPYECGVCGKRFANKSNWRAHMRTHTGEKPYVCATCGAAFKNSQPLRQHEKTHVAAAEAGGGFPAVGAPPAYASPALEAPMVGFANV
ncbi:PREDICTED: zinc finger protein 500-like [Priapulus caudatus]|uniref:Zinc finger protein 500-like n=1 Tax=Priapulus caudatus TaxID=37621 RepID=A0ABM1EAW7_PRICU|nr:PREDICTED: zinc finger protein 500-like [Priapulus caudatus]